MDGNDDELKAIATGNASAIAAGHVFVVALRGGYPINIKNYILETPEVCTIFCATANPLEVIVAQTEQGRGVLGVIDGSAPKGVERRIPMSNGATGCYARLDTSASVLPALLCFRLEMRRGARAGDQSGGQPLQASYRLAPPVYKNLQSRIASAVE